MFYSWYCLSPYGMSMYSLKNSCIVFVFTMQCEVCGDLQNLLIILCSYFIYHTHESSDPAISSPLVFLFSLSFSQPSASQCQVWQPCVLSMCSSLQHKLKGGGRREASREWGREEEEPPCPGHWVISGEKSLWACGHGLKEKREGSEEESVDTHRKLLLGVEIRKPVNNQYLYILSIKVSSNVEQIPSSNLYVFSSVADVHEDSSGRNESVENERKKERGWEMEK